jgi:hypothetical protein
VLEKGQGNKPIPLDKFIIADLFYLDSNYLIKNLVKKTNGKIFALKESKIEST